MEFEPAWRAVYESDNDAFFAVGYGATRRVERLDSFDSGARLKSRTTRDLRVQSLFEEAFSLIPLGSWLPRLKEGRSGLYEQVEHLFEALLKPGVYRFTGKLSKGGDYLFDRGGMDVPFQSMSDGYRAFIGWVSDLLHHLCMGGRSRKDLAESRGIVMVDEVDLHLHPKWQMQVIGTISRALPNMQFIFTSHSPLVAGSIEWMNIVTLKVNARTNRTRARRLQESIHGLDADQILLTDFFGLSTTPRPPRPGNWRSSGTARPSETTVPNVITSGLSPPARTPPIRRTPRQSGGMANDPLRHLPG